MTAPPVRVGVIGTGALGYHHARLLRRMAGVSFAGIYDKNPARAADVAKQLETVAHPALAALLERVDAVTVAVPTPAHVDVGMAVLERGIALLMEKPLADAVGDGRVVFADLECVIEEPGPLADDAGQLAEPGQAAGRQQDR